VNGLGISPGGPPPGGPKDPSGGPPAPIDGPCGPGGGPPVSCANAVPAQTRSAKTAVPVQMLFIPIPCSMPSSDCAWVGLRLHGGAISAERIEADILRKQIVRLALIGYDRLPGSREILRILDADAILECVRAFESETLRGS